MVHKGRSPVWCHAIKLDSKVARCKHCGNIIVHDGNTSNIQKHLNSKHPLIPIELSEKQSISKSNSQNKARKNEITKRKGCGRTGLESSESENSDSVDADVCSIFLILIFVNLID